MPQARASVAIRELLGHVIDGTLFQLSHNGTNGYVKIPNGLRSGMRGSPETTTPRPGVVPEAPSQGVSGGATPHWFG
jgi:hypothetical protein